MSDFLSTRFAGLTPYTPGEQPTGKKLIKLNTNESPYPPPPEVQQAACQAAAGYNLYSDPTCTSAVQALAGHYGVEPGQVFAGNGSDEVLTLCFAAYCLNGAAFADITYGFYPVLAGLFNSKPTVVPLRDNFVLQPEDYYNAGQTVIIANPNAPTGLALTLQQIEGIVQHNPGNVVIIDEAYVDFGAQSAVPLVQQYPNLMVVGTFSKSRSMAGARFGYAIAQPTLIEDLNLLKYSFNPYNVNSATLAAASAAIASNSYFKTCCSKIMATRQHTLQTLRQMGFTATNSMANFVFVKHAQKSGRALYLALREQGILVRWWNKAPIADYLRITIGTSNEMEALFAALRKILV